MNPSATLFGLRWLLSLAFLLAVLVSFPVALSGALGNRSAACEQQSPAVVYVPFVLQSSGYTPSEAAQRATARRGYAVGKPRYARAVHGIVGRRYAGRW